MSGPRGRAPDAEPGDPIHIVPGVALGPIRLGMERSDVLAAVGPAAKGQRRECRDLDVLDFDGLGLHVHFDAAGRVEFVEAFLPARPVLDGLDLLRVEWAVLASTLAERGAPPLQDHRAPSGFDLPAARVTFYVPYHDGPAESVGLYREGYYDD